MRSIVDWRPWATRFACALVFAHSITGCFADMGDALPPDSGSDAIASNDATPLSDSSTTEGATDAVSTDGTDAQTLIDAGKTVFFTAGGVGCSSCHGANAEGMSGDGPNIRGKTESQIITALTTVKTMAVLKYPDKLTPADVHAVAAYLGWLATQPP